MEKFNVVVNQLIKFRIQWILNILNENEEIGI